MDDDFRVHGTHEEVILILRTDPTWVSETEQVELIVPRLAAGLTGLGGRGDGDGPRLGRCHGYLLLTAISHEFGPQCADPSATAPRRAS